MRVAALYEKLQRSYDGDDAGLSVSIMEQLANEPIRTPEDAGVKARWLAELVESKESFKGAVAGQLAAWLAAIPVLVTT